MFSFKKNVSLSFNIDVTIYHIMHLQMCYDLKEGNDIQSGVLAATSNVTMAWNEDENSLIASFLEPVPTAIYCLCDETQTDATFDKPTGFVRHQSWTSP